MISAVHTEHLWAVLRSYSADCQQGGKWHSQSSRQVVRQATEEEKEEDDPFKVVDERIAERVGVETVLEDGG